MRICGYTYVTEGIPDEHLNYDGSPLLNCSQCKLQCYKSAADQKAHWKLHKCGCKAVGRGGSTSGLPAKTTTLQDCKRRLGELLYSGTSNHELPHLLRKIRMLMDSGGDGDVGDVAFELHSMARGLIFNPQNKNRTVIYNPEIQKMVNGK